MLGLDLGDAHIIRNGGGRASDDAIRSLALGRALLGIETVLVIHHTDCRLRGATTDNLREVLAWAGADVPPSAEFLPLPPVIEDGLRVDVGRIRGAAMIPPGLTVHGLIYDVRTGRLRKVSL
jgi:carbonic anhydrase